MIEHIYSTKEKLYRLFSLPVQADFITGQQANMRKIDKCIYLNI